MTTGVLIADDHQILREGLRNLLREEDDIEVLGEAADGRSAVKLAKELRPDVVIMDVAMPDLNGVEATFQLKHEIPQVRVLALSMHSDRRFVRRMLQVGARGYLLKDCAFEELTAAVRTVGEDRVYLSPGVAELVLEDYRSCISTEDDPTTAKLTPREREVLQLLAEGRTTREIATTLHVSVKTVETHRKQIMDRLDLHSVAELTKYAIREGLTTL